MERTIGFSTGSAYKFANPISVEVIKLIQQLGCNAIEINWHSFKNNPNPFDNQKFINSLANSNCFKSISLHLPCDIKYHKRQNNESDMVFFQVWDFWSKIPLKYLLLHPDIVENWNLFDRPNFPQFPSIAIENMDRGKESFQFLGEWLIFFDEHPDFQFVFDVNHWISNKETTFGIDYALKKSYYNHNNLIGIHLSGFEKYHEPLFKTKQSDLVETFIHLPSHIPIILESVCENAHEMEKELAYVKKILN